MMIFLDFMIILFFFNLQILELILMKIEIERDKKHPESRREKKGS